MKTTRSKSILMLVENCPYPQDVRVRNEANTLIQAGYQVIVVAQKATGQKYYQAVDNVIVYRYPAPPELPSIFGFAIEYLYSYFVALFYSIWILIRHGFDVIHAHNPPDIYVFIAIFYRLFGKKFVFDHHDLTPEIFKVRFAGAGTKFIYRVLLFMEYCSVRLADRIIATNESYKNRQVSLHGTDPAKVTVVRNGPDLRQFQSVAPDPHLRSKAGTILGYAGTMGKQDGVDYLIRAVHHLVFNLNEKDVYCVLLGNGSEEASLKKLVTDLQLDDYVWFPGWVEVDTLVRYLCSADICLGPDPKNSFTDHSTMIKIMEYMALEKPIVSFDLSETIYSAADAALYVSGNSEADFAGAIKQLIEDPALCRKMGQAGSKRVQKELAWEYSAQKLLLMYEGLFAEKAPSSS